MNSLIAGASLLGTGIVIGLLVARGQWLELLGGILMLGLLFVAITWQGRNRKEV